jgi:hypothetical protein
MATYEIRAFAFTRFTLPYAKSSYLSGFRIPTSPFRFLYKPVFWCYLPPTRYGGEENYINWLRSQ